MNLPFTVKSILGLSFGVLSATSSHLGVRELLWGVSAEPALVGERAFKSNHSLVKCEIDSRSFYTAQLLNLPPLG